MPRVKRPADVSVRLAEVSEVDIAALTRGELRVSKRQQAMAGSPIVDSEQKVSEDELRVLMRVSSSGWQASDEVAAGLSLNVDVVDGLVAKGLLLCEGDDHESRSGRDRDERYTRTLWHPGCAAYHFRSRWRDQSLGSVGEQIERVRAYPEAPPDPFYDHPEPLRREDLPLVEEDRPLHRLLRARRTTRSFDRDRALPLGELSAVLFHSFGCQGVARRTVYPALKKNSASGGALHPIEVYPLVRDVEGISSGLYHYNVRAHALDLIRETDRDEAEHLALHFVAGQDYFAPAHVMCVVAIRFYRHTWKYRRQPGSYRVMLLDAAHASQTFFLVCTERGLGAFFTAAVNHANIEEELGLDPYAQGVVGVNGCGIRKDPDPLALIADPYSPQA